MGRRKMIEAGTELLSGYSKNTAPRATKLVKNKGISKRLKELDIPKANSTFHINTSNADNVSQLVNREARQAELEKTFKQGFVYDRNKIITTDAKNNPMLDKNAFKNERNKMLKEYDEVYEKMERDGTVPYYSNNEGRFRATKDEFRIISNKEDMQRRVRDKRYQLSDDAELRAATTKQKQLEATQKYGSRQKYGARKDSKIGQRHKASPLTPEGVREVTGNNLFGGIPTPSTDTFDLIQELSGRGIHSGNGINIPESKGPVRPQSKTGAVGGPTVKNSMPKSSESPQLNKINERNRAKSKAAEKAAKDGDKTIFGLTSKQMLGAAVGGGLIFSMFNRGGQMTNSELYGQSSPYGY